VEIKSGSYGPSRYGLSGLAPSRGIWRAIASKPSKSLKQEVVTRCGKFPTLAGRIAESVYFPDDGRMMMRRGCSRLSVKPGSPFRKPAQADWVICAPCGLKSGSCGST